MFLRSLKKRFDRGDYDLHAVRIRNNVEEISSIGNHALTGKDVDAYFRWQFSPGQAGNFKLSEDKPVPDNLRRFGLLETFFLDHIDNVVFEYPLEQRAPSDIYAISKLGSDTAIRIQFRPSITDIDSATVGAINLSSGARHDSKLESDDDGLIDAACDVLSTPKFRWRSLKDQKKAFNRVYPMTIDDAQKCILSNEFVDKKAPWARVEVVY